MRRPLLSVLALFCALAVAACGGDDDPIDPDAGATPDADEPDASPFRCGNGVIDPGEDCEQGDLGGQDCLGLGFDGGTLFCNLDCSFDTESCSSVSCGDDTIDGTDLCDGQDLGTATCQSLGFQPGGTLACNDSCDGYVTTGCTPLSCGDGDIDAGETCDGTALNNQTCVSRGFASGQLECADTCQDFDTSNCVPSVCGNNVVETGEDCDDGDTVADELCTADCQFPGGPTITTCQTLPPLAGGATCEVTAGNTSRLITGNILTPGEVLVGGQVLVDAAGIIQCTACDCSAMGVGATQVSCPTGVVSPGLINSHDHITFTQNDPYTATDERYEHRHDWRTGTGDHTEIPASGGASASQVRWGELRFLMGGATSIVGSGSATGFLRNLDTSNQEGLGQTAVDFSTFPLGDSSGTRRTMDCNYGNGDTESVFNSTDAYEPHVSEGIDTSARNEFLCVSSTTYDTTSPGVSHDLTTGESAFIHSTGLRAVDYAAMGVDGTALIWSPRSNITLYGDTAQVSTADNLGVLIALGTDWTPTGSMNLLRELRCADEFNTTYLDGHFTDEELWMMVTYNAAQATATDDVIGRLAPGLVADIAIYDGAVNPLHRAVIDAEPEDVVFVMRGGKPLYGDAAIVAGLTSDTCDTVDVCGDSKRVCVMSEIGQTYSAFSSAHASIYPAFFCTEPDNEPTCVPERTRTSAPNPASVNGSTVYDGIPAASDMDGDGINDGSDNCPSVFNPIRPLDNGAQADHDNDGEGDPCDVCPINADTTTCTPPDPNDSDGDGVVNAMDNCPNDANSGQEDADDDDKGDACDACPMDPNPGAAACPATIYEVKDGTIPAGTTVQITNAIVTGRYASGFFIQVREGDAGYLGADFSGLFVFAPSNTVAEGDRVTVTGGIADFFGQIQMSNPTAVVVNATGQPLPAPIAVTVAEVTTGGARADELEGVLVRVSDVTVSALDMPFNEFIVSTTPPGATTLRINDLLFLPSPFPAVNDYFTQITGLLNFRNSNSKIEPRRASDLVSGLAMSSFGPASSFVRVSGSGVPTFPSPLTVTINSAQATDTFVAISSSAPGSLTVVNGGVVIPAGQLSAPVLVDTTATPATSVTLTATLATQMLTANVRVLGTAEAPAALSLTPATATLSNGGTLPMTVTFDIPVATDTAVSLALTPSTAGTVPATVTVLANQTSATFDYVHGGSDTSVTVTATGASLMDSSAIAIVMSSSDHLVINEIDYDQAGTDAGEYVEIYNGTGVDVSLANVQLAMINGSAAPVEYARHNLSMAGATLPAGGYLLIRNTAVPANGAMSMVVPGDSVQNGANDGIVLIVGNVAVDAIAYEGTLAPMTISGVTAQVTFTNLALTDDATYEVLVRTPNGVDTNMASDWVLGSTLTPGTVNP